MSKTFSFRELQAGMTARVKSLREGDGLSNRLLELGLVPGTEFDVVRIAPFGDPVEIEVRGYRLCLRRSECACLVLESVPA